MTLGRLIALEGPDGSGKTTQAARLARWLGEGLGRDVVTCRDPGGTPLGERIRPVLLERSSTPIGMTAEMLLYMACRSQLIEEVIGPAMRRGAIVVTDRFLLSNVVYQGYAGGLSPDSIWNVGKIATGDILPDITLLIDVPVEVALLRVGPGRDRIEDRGNDYRERVRQGYLEALKSMETPVAIIDGSRSPEEVEAQIRNEVRSALGIGSRT
jgi:dTMP kinase